MSRPRVVPTTTTGGRCPSSGGALQRHRRRADLPSTVRAAPGRSGSGPTRRRASARITVAGREPQVLRQACAVPVSAARKGGGGTPGARAHPRPLLYAGAWPDSERRSFRSSASVRAMNDDCPGKSAGDEID